MYLVYIEKENNISHIILLDLEVYKFLSNILTHLAKMSTGHSSKNVTSASPKLQAAMRRLQLNSSTTTESAETMAGTGLHL